MDLLLKITFPGPHSPDLNLDVLFTPVEYEQKWYEWFQNKTLKEALLLHSIYCSAWMGRVMRWRRWHHSMEEPVSLKHRTEMSPLKRNWVWAANANPKEMSFWVCAIMQFGHLVVISAEVTLIILSPSTFWKLLATPKSATSGFAL